MKKVAIFFAEGFEEIEALTVVDMCRRAGIDIDMVSVTESLEVTGTHHIPVIVDKELEEIDFEEYDMLVLPGGWPGTPNLEKSFELMKQVKIFGETKKWVAAICAAPSILGHLGLLKGKKACCYPGFEEHLEGAHVTFDRHQVDGNIITGRGMGCAIDFSVAIIDALLGEGKGREIAEKICC